MSSEQAHQGSRRGVGSRLIYKLKRFARYIGIHKRVITMPDGVRYRERTGISIRRAISPNGPGVKEFDVRFPWIDHDGRRSMRIRYTASRIYGDLGHDPRTVMYAQIMDLITPGLRVMELRCGTGSGSSILADAVGPSGGVMAIDRDGEAIRFARQRHRSDHCGFELGWIDTFQGEPDNAFDAIIGCDLHAGSNDAIEQANTFIEIGRTVRPQGLIIALASTPDDLSVVRDAFMGLGLEHQRDLVRDPRSGWAGVVFKRPKPDSTPPIRDPYSPGSFQS